MFYTFGRGSDLNRTVQFIYKVLLHRAYLEGTRYYRTPECFLFFLTRLLKSSNDAELHQLFDSLLKERVQELVGGDGDPLTLSMRILTCKYVGIVNEGDLRKLLPLQCEDGGWETGWMYRFGTSGIKIGNRGLTTAMAINAIEALRPSPPSHPEPLPNPEPLPVPELVPASVFAPISTPVPTPVETSVSTSVPKQELLPEPEPTPATAPATALTPVPTPVLTSVLTPEPLPEPEPIPASVLATVPTPVPTPVLTSVPTPEPLLEPEFISASVLETVPAPAPAPVPTSVPTPKPIPASTLATVPTPVPAPVLIPVPALLITPPSTPLQPRSIQRASISISTPIIDRSLSPTDTKELSVRKKRHGRRSSIRLSFQWLQNIL